MENSTELTQQLEKIELDEELEAGEKPHEDSSPEEEEESGSELTDSEEDPDAYLADDDGSEYKLDVVSIDNVRKSDHNKEMLSLCRKVRKQPFNTLIT